jgi:mitochondrial fission process protein 1
MSNERNCVAEVASSGVHVDIFRDTPVRYMGYANEVGEAFRPIFPKFVLPSYGIAFLYVGADTVNKTKDAYTKGASHSTAISSGLDCLVWQTLASVLIPGKVIQGVTAMSVKAMQGAPASIAKYKSVVKFAPTIVGLAFIPLIIKPIDEAVDVLLDSTLRQVLPKHEEEHGGN